MNELPVTLSIESFAFRDNLQCVSKKHPPPMRPVYGYLTYHKRLRILSQFLHTYVPTTLDYKFLFSYLKC